MNSLRKQYEQEVAAGLRRPSPSPEILTEADTALLPVPVQRYLAFVGAIDKPQVWNYRMRFRGALRNGPTDRWMPMTARQQSFVASPARLFLVEAAMFGIPALAFHRYVGPQATFQVRIASLLTIVDARGDEMNRSETVTLLNDMFLLAPGTLIDPKIAWEELDPMTVRATWSNAGNTVAAVASFDRTGALVNFVSDDRCRTTDGKTYTRLRWSTPVHGWRKVSDRTLFARGESLWELDGQPFAYGRFELLDAQYNVRI